MATLVPFVTVEDGDDLIVFFGLGEHAANSLTLLRTPKFEALLAPEERGVTVSSDLADRELLVSIAWNELEVRIESTERAYVLDVSAVDPVEAREAKEVLRKMNFDQRFVVRDV